MSATDRRPSHRSRIALPVASLESMPIYIAQANGLFKKHNVDVDVITSRGGGLREPNIPIHSIHDYNGGAIGDRRDVCASHWSRDHRTTGFLSRGIDDVSNVGLEHSR